MLDKERVIAEVAAKHKVRVEPDDPYFAAATITQMALEETVRELQVRIHASIAEFDASVRVVERRAGKMLAQEVKDCAAAIRGELQKDIVNATKKARELINEVKLAHEVPNRIIWASIGLFCALALFLSGVWFGRLTPGP
jgi:CHASE3 domain sensor protein